MHYNRHSLSLPLLSLSIGYTAPELYDPGKYNHSADVFSFSMVFINLFTTIIITAVTTTIIIIIIIIITNDKVLWQLYSHKPDLPFHDNEKLEFINDLGNGKRPVFGSEHPGLIKELLDVGWGTYYYYYYYYLLFFIY